MARRRYQTGCLYLRKGKSASVWVGQFREDTIDREGNVRRVLRKIVLGNTSELKTRKLAQRSLAKRLEAINSPTYRPGRTATFAEFLESWRTNVLALRKPSSAKAAESHLRTHLLPELGLCRLEELDGYNVQRFVTKLSRKVSRHTLLNVLGTLGGILRAARAFGYSVGNYSRDSLVFPTDDSKPARFFSANQVQRILANLTEEPFRTMFCVAALTGLRAGEVCGLSLDSVDPGRKTLTVLQSAWYGRLQSPKSRHALRTVPLPDVLVGILKNYLRNWKPNAARLLFATRNGRPYSANQIVQRKLWPILDALEIPRAGFHAFRHAASTLLVDSGASPATVQAQLGHADPRITLGAYSHTVEKSHREAIEKISQILMPNDTKGGGTPQWIQ